MRVILKENIDNLGRKGDIVDVAAGYGRNFLIPRKLAIKVSPSNMKMIEMEQQALRKKFNQEKATHQDLVDKLNETRLTFIRKTAEKDVIFGSVSPADIREALSELGMDVDKKKILLDEPIKRLGNYTVPVKVFHDERAEVGIEVITQEKASAKEEKPPEGIKEKTEGGTEEVQKEEPPDRGKKEAEAKTAEAEDKAEETAETVIMAPEEDKTGEEQGWQETPSEREEDGAEEKNKKAPDEKEAE